MDQLSKLVQKSERDIRTIKMPPGLSPRGESSKPSTAKGQVKSQKVFSSVKQLPGDSFGIKQITSKQFDAVIRKSKSTVKKIPAGKKSKNSTTAGIMQTIGARVSRIQQQGRSKYN
jgi:hypothetical protein